MTDTQILNDLLHFLENSPTAWHAVSNLKEKFREHQFQELHLAESWELKPGGRYFVTCLDSTLAAFIVPKNLPSSICLLGTHTDSPGLKLKPKSEFIQNNMLMFGVEVYGAPLLASWLNRDLGLAGRIYYYDENHALQTTLINIDHSPIAIPQLAIHLDRGVNETGLVLNKENHLAAIACLQEKTAKKDSYLEVLLQSVVSLTKLISHELFLYPLDRPRYLGKNREMVAGYRLDNLCSVHAAAHALTCTKKPHETCLNLALFWDHEEIGSETAQGANSPFLLQLIERITLALDLSREHFLRLLQNALCVSIDLAHALHPNYPEKHEKQHQPLLNEGIVLKINAQQRYATSGQTAAVVAEKCAQLKIPLQSFVVRNDMPCGSTIGPITATVTGIPTVDIGIPQLSMHSTREIIGSQDHLHMCHLLSSIFSNVAEKQQR